MKERLLLPALLLLAGFLVSACHHIESEKTQPTAPAATTHSIHKSPNDDRRYAAITLPNGLQVVLVSDPTLENAAATLALPVGSAQDPADFEGMAHYLEHMLFLGTQKYPEPDALAKFVQANGGMNNASTFKDKTYYLFQVNTGQFDQALDMFSDYFKTPRFDKTYAEKQRDAVSSEWSMQRSQYVWNLWRLNELTANPNNPHSQFSIGNLQTLTDKPGKILQDNLVAFYERYYSANIMRLTLVGKQSIPELTALAQKHFSGIANKRILVPTITEPGFTDAQLAQHIYYKPTQDARALFIDFPVKSNRDFWRFKPNEFLLNLISSQEEGTLFAQMRKQGLVTNMSAFIEAEHYGPDGYLRIETELTEKGLKQQDEVVAAVFAYIDLIKREGLNERYYAELKALAEKNFINSNKLPPLDQSIELAVGQLYLPVENLLDSNAIYERYDEAIVKGLMEQLQPKKARVWTISNQEVADKDISFFDGKYSMTPIDTQTFNGWISKSDNYHFNLPPLNNLFTPESAAIVSNLYLKPHAVISRAGVEAFVVQPEFYREDKGQLVVEINSPLGQTTAKNRVLSNLLVRIFEQQNSMLIDRAARASLELAIKSSATNSPEISISGYTSKHAFLLDDIMHTFAAFKVTPQEFAAQLDSYTQELRNDSKTKVVSQLFNHAHRLVSAQGWTSEQLLRAAKTVTAQNLTAYYQALKRDPLLRIYASGNYSEDDVKTMAIAAANLLPGHRLPLERVLPVFAIPQQGQWKNYQSSVDLDDSGILHAWFTDNGGDAERAEMEVLDAVFYPAAYTQLRTNEQLGYVVDGGYFPIANTLGFFMAVQSANSDLVKIKSRMDNFRKTYIDTLRAIDETEIEKIKQAKIATLLQKPTDFNSEASRYAREFWRGEYRFDKRERQVAAFESVTKAKVIARYEKLLLADNNSGIYVQLRGNNFKTAAFSSLR